MPPPPPPAAPELAPTLPAELIEEIFLRLPPDEPEWLVRASLASKQWLGRLTAPRFHGRYTDFHRAPPMLGFFYSRPYYASDDPLFVSTTKLGACIPDPENWGHSYLYDAWDCRHGRVLLGLRGMSPTPLTVLDPMTGRQRKLDAPGPYNCYAAAVLCAVNGCDHRACHDGPSRVVFVGLGLAAAGFVARAYLSLPETGESHLRHRQWSKPSRLLLGDASYIQPVPPVLIQDTLYFMISYDDEHVGILRYELRSNCLSLIDAPVPEKGISHITMLMGMEDGSLGFVRLDVLTLNLWTRKMGGVGSWTECRVIDLNELLPFPKKRLRLMGSMEGGDTIFVTWTHGIYEINLKSLEWKKIGKKEHFCTLIPYASFYNPQERVPCDAAH